MFEGLFALPWWGIALATLGLTQITIASVTIFLHRHQAHRALTLNPAISHFFRFWLWLTSGIVTREWVAIHRKHHAKVETPEDPHSPLQKGINRVVWGGYFLYIKEAQNQETLEKYSFGTPDDWLERNVYSRFSWFGVMLMLGIDVMIFGVLAGPIAWIVQMIWIPIWAAGVINGIGHYWGYRNFEVKDASTNIVPWGLFIGGEELHNNHHAYASSAKLSSRPWEIDIGWLYIRLLESLGMARVKKLPPQLHSNPSKTQLDLETVKAVVRNRFQIMARFSREVMRSVHREELRKADRSDSGQFVQLKRAYGLMKKEIALLNQKKRDRLSSALENNATLNTVYEMKQKLQAIWDRSARAQDNALQALEEWCRQAEATGIKALTDFSAKLRTYTLQPVAA